MIVKRNIGILFFVVGVILAISSGAKVPEPGKTYPDTLGTFALGMALSIAGLILWRHIEKLLVRENIKAHMEDEATNPLLLLQNTYYGVKELHQSYDQMSDKEVCDKIDEIEESSIIPFVEKRKTLNDLLGQDHGSELQLIVAYGERMLNRVWSAVSDGHRPEGKSCLNESLENYAHAEERASKFLAEEKL